MKSHESDEQPSPLPTPIVPTPASYGIEEFSLPGSSPVHLTQTTSVLSLFIGSVPHGELEDLAILFEMPLEGHDQVIYHSFLSQANLQAKKVALELFKGDENSLELEAG